ncbi:uncharacterized protein YvpB [Oikeobacillus pervagus]|uniref:Uncharacterized protein YvpB n=1 Tax=Oikeobacillus pervagus TaxID=1325931 RepID=A0AAJ1T241_9BACI|nr:C39 family peptidase [Oikeobacillus pervagus]MDQ0215772.1 uncharacterized protein YvpB [Oikeobacillus pervagus]
MTLKFILLLILIMLIVFVILIWKRFNGKLAISSFIMIILILFGMFLSLDENNQERFLYAIDEPLFKHYYSVIKMKDSTLIDAPLVAQLPELPRGCEVTSLAMLLQSAGVSTDKMTLASEIKRNPATYKKENGKIYFGNPANGFVGNMYTFEEPGLGVFHEPIAELAKKYLPDHKVLDLSGGDFEDIKIQLSDGRPVWVIINTAYDELPDHYFQTWHTEDGEIRITYKEHSVLITGYDEEYIYFNDPLTNTKNKKQPIQTFEKSWIQMGRQAITYLP